MEKCCVNKYCTKITIKCRHCEKICCTKHTQQELHMCDKLLTKDKIVLEAIKAPKIIYF